MAFTKFPPLTLCPSRLEMRNPSRDIFARLGRRHQQSTEIKKPQAV